MKSLKRTLCLVLALVMVLGFFGIASAATFNDQDKITNPEAVNTMVTLGVINGKNGNVFDPAGNVTRAEMAKMICYALNGGKAPVLGNAAPSFNDTKGHWASNYIEYCVNLGIIAGMGNGTFAPDASVTGSQAAKMLLCALGYRADIEKLTGPSWELNTNVIANKVKLYDGLNASFKASEVMNRDNAAQMLYNYVQAYEVEYRNLQGDYSGVLYPVEQRTVLASRFNVVKVTGIVQANDKIAFVGNVTKAGETRLDVSSISSNSRPTGGWGTMTFDVALDDALVGQEVVVYVQFKNNLAPNAVGAVVLGTPIATEANTVVSTYAILKDADAVKGALKAAGIKVQGNNDMYTYSANAPATSLSTANTGIIGGVGILQTFIDNNDDGIVDIIVRKGGSLARVTSVTSTKTTFSTIGTVNSEDIVCADKLAKDDFAVVTLYDNNKYYVTKSTPVEGVVKAFAPGKVAAVNKITVGDKTYMPSNFTDATSGALTAGTAMPSTEIGSTVALYLDPYGNIIAYKVVSATVSNFAVVLGTSTTGSTSMGYTAKAKLLEADGSTNVYDVDLLSSSVALGLATPTASNATKMGAIITANYFNIANDGGTSLKDNLFAYNKTDAGVVTLIAPEAINAKYSTAAISNALNLDKNDASYALNGADTVVFDANTYFFIENDTPASTYSVVKGLENLPATAKATTAAGESVFFQSTVGATKAAKAVWVKLATGSYSSNENYAYIAGNYTQTVVEGTNVYTYPAVLADGTLTTLTTAIPGVEAGNVYKYAVGAKGLVTFTGDANIINNARISYLGDGAVVLKNADTDAAAGSLTLDKGMNAWNVENTGKQDDIAATSLSENNAVCVVKDPSTGAVKLVFVTGNMLGDMTANVGETLTKVAGSCTVVSNTSITGAAANDTIKVAYTATTAQKVKVVIDGAGTDVNPASATDGTGATQDSGTYTITAGDIGSTITVTVVVTEANKDTRTMTYTVTVAS